jgi:hypothetical protein
MTTIDKKDYCKPGAETMGAHIAFSQTFIRSKEYFVNLCQELAHACLGKFEKEFSEIAADRIERLIRVYDIPYGKIILTVPVKAIKDITSAKYLFSVFDLKVISGLEGRIHYIDTKVY